MKSINIISCFLFVFLAISCKQDKKTNGGSDQMLVNSNKYKLEKYNSGIKSPGASLKYMRLVDGKLDFQVSGFELGSENSAGLNSSLAKDPNGSHIHLIIDNDKSENHYTSNFDIDLNDGSHYLVGFLADSYNEGVKNMNSARAAQLIMENGKMTVFNSLDIPTMIYHLPKGEYRLSESDKIMLDFQLFNCNLGSEFKVKVDINGEQFLIDEWEAHLISGLQPGEYTVELTLLDHLNKKVLAPFNPSKKTITVLP